MCTPEKPKLKYIDENTLHRSEDDWDYGRNTGITG